jgi:hypothetical protein
VGPEALRRRPRRRRPVLILGGIHGDLPIEPTAGAIVADLVVDEDVNVDHRHLAQALRPMWSQGEKIRFVRDYCLRLFERQGERRRPLMQVIDEAGRFVPQQIPKGASTSPSASARSSSSSSSAATSGRRALITQRSARMNKSVSELAEMMVAFRTVGPRSIDAILDWFGEHVPKDRWRELVERLRKLPRGTALVVSPGWLDVEGEYAMRARETFDSSDTPPAVKHNGQFANQARTPIAPRTAPRDAAPPPQGGLPKGELATLTAIAQHPGATRKQLTVMTRYKKSTRDTYLKRLGGRGLVELVGDGCTATDAGLAALGDFEPLPTGSCPPAAPSRAPAEG